MHRIFLGLVMATTTLCAQESRATIDSLRWLAGCWEGRFRDGTVVMSEQWMRPLGGTLLGMSRTVVSGSTRQTEFLRIVQNEDGSVDYVADPSSQAQATFRLTEISPTHVVFENPDHDFPQRIIYRRADPDSVIGRIEGTRNGRFRAVDFPYRRASCE